VATTIGCLWAAIKDHDGSGVFVFGRRRGFLSLGGETIFFVSCVKMVRKWLVKSLFLAPSFIIFLHDTKNISFS
jgi:hypothetical protein